MTGPRRLPSPQAARTSEKYLGRCRSGMISAKMTCPIVIIPPPPIPCTERPTKKTPNPFAAGAHSRVPNVNNMTDTKSISVCPNMSDSAAMKGWHTAHASRYDVPAQNASVALPSRSRANVCQVISIKSLLSRRGSLTGKTETRIVASRATMSEIRASVSITAYSCFPGFQCAGSRSKPVLRPITGYSLFSIARLDPSPHLSQFDGTEEGLRHVVADMCRAY